MLQVQRGAWIDHTKREAHIHFTISHQTIKLFTMTDAYDALLVVGLRWLKALLLPLCDQTCSSFTVYHPSKNKHSGSIRPYPWTNTREASLHARDPRPGLVRWFLCNALILRGVSLRIGSNNVPIICEFERASVLYGTKVLVLETGTE
eukprot:scaffold84655_cov21-Tisochrysis_lutea.AAC.1